MVFGPNQDGIDKQFLAAPVKSAVDKYRLLPEFLKVRGLVNQHLDSFNYFVTTGLKKIVHANNEIRSRVDSTVFLRYNNVRVGEPCVIVNSVLEQLNPHRCRLSDYTYAAPIYVDVKYVVISNGTKNVVSKSDVVIGKLPVMLRSCCCVLHGNEEELARLGECPLDPGGYFIVKGMEKVILIQEQLSKNRIIIDTDAKGCVQASVMSSTEVRKSKTR